jgi:transcriptional regulator with XRE-family HTH domain
MANNKVRAAFGKRVRTIRSEQGFSQEAFADAVGLHRTYIGAIERGEQNVSIDNIVLIAKALKVSLSRLFDGIK